MTDTVQYISQITITLTYYIHCDRQTDFDRQTDRQIDRQTA